MSFSGTPLGQGRRLDHSTFLGKHSSNNGPPSPHHNIPTSYAYGASTLGARSPPKSPVRSRHNNHNNHAQDEGSALDRFARIKQREAELSSRPGGPKTFTSPPHSPEKWAIKDTSVNLATALHQAANNDYSIIPPMNDPNQSWASSSRPYQRIPRSTSVEYEKETQNTKRRLPPPPSKRRDNVGATTRKPLSKTNSNLTVPDSEVEADRSQSMDPNGSYTRGKSPFEFVDKVVNTLKPTVFHMIQRMSQEPEDRSADHSASNGKTNGHQNESYDYAEEERAYDALSQQAQTNSKRPNNAGHKRGRISLDAKAYVPSEDEDDEDFSDDDRGKARRKKKGGAFGGPPLHNLPKVGYEKQRRRRKGGTNKDDNLPEFEDRRSTSEEEEIEPQTHREADQSRGSVPPSQLSAARGSTPQETEVDIEQGLDSIPEADESQLDDQTRHQQLRQISEPPARFRFSIGGFLGSLVHIIFSAALFTCILMGKVFGWIFHIFFFKPTDWISRPNNARITTMARYVFLGLTLSAAWYALNLGSVSPAKLLDWTYHRPNHTYIAPELPPETLADIVTRLQAIEVALSSYSINSEKLREQTEKEANIRSELSREVGSLYGQLGKLDGKIGVLEGRVSSASGKMEEAERRWRNDANPGATQALNHIKRDVEALSAQVKAQQVTLEEQVERQKMQDRDIAKSGGDEEAQAMLKALEERIGSVEGGVREAIELGKQAAAKVTSSSSTSAWWNKLASGSKHALTIKSSDGQDVTALISHLVESAMLTYSKDILAKPDFALHSGGAWVIPSLTSPTFEVKPSSLRSSVLSLLTGGNGYAVGRPPITALHHELHNGHCWPFKGTQGQLGVVLSSPIYVEEVVIEHSAKEVAFDIRTAPRQMEVWGLVEGKDNLKRMKEWREEQRKQREVTGDTGDDGGAHLSLNDGEGEYPKTLPKNAPYIRIAKFSYDIHAPNHIQAFPVLPEVEQLHVDFGIVVLMVKSNWGRDDFTCLYRMRVHGQRMGETPLPYPQETHSS